MELNFNKINDLNATITVELVKIEKEWLPEDISPVLLNNIKILL